MGFNAERALRDEEPDDERGAVVPVLGGRIVRSEAQERIRELIAPSWETAASAVARRFEQEGPLQRAVAALGQGAGQSVRDAIVGPAASVLGATGLESGFFAQARQHEQSVLGPQTRQALLAATQSEMSAGTSGAIQAVEQARRSLDRAAGDALSGVARTVAESDASNQALQAAQSAAVSSLSGLPRGVIEPSSFARVSGAEPSAMLVLQAKQALFDAASDGSAGALGAVSAADASDALVQARHSFAQAASSGLSEHRSAGAFEGLVPALDRARLSTTAMPGQSLLSLFDRGVAGPSIAGPLGLSGVQSTLGRALALAQSKSTVGIDATMRFNVAEVARQVEQAVDEVGDTSSTLYFDFLQARQDALEGNETRVLQFARKWWTTKKMPKSVLMRDKEQNDASALATALILMDPDAFSIDTALTLLGEVPAAARKRRRQECCIFEHEWRGRPIESIEEVAEFVGVERGELRSAGQQAHDVEADALAGVDAAEVDNQRKLADFSDPRIVALGALLSDADLAVFLAGAHSSSWRAAAVDCGLPPEEGDRAWRRIKYRRDQIADAFPARATTAKDGKR